MVLDGKTGYLVDSGDFRAMAAHVLDLLSSRQRWEETAKNALADVRERFGVEDHVKRIVQIYEDVLSA